MGKKAIYPENFEENIIWHSITGTYIFYVLGALYILAPAIGWTLFAYLIIKLVKQYVTGTSEKYLFIPYGVWAWTLSMLVMLLVLWQAHIEWELGTMKIIKSSIGWAKGWALLAIFPLIGCLDIRPEIIYRASAILCKQTITIFPFLLFGYLIGLPGHLYVSPLSVVGGATNEYFNVSLYTLDYSGNVRFFLFGPWAPATGFIANIYLLFALQEKETYWKVMGIIGSILMILVCKSRLAFVSAILFPAMIYTLGNLHKVAIFIQAAITSLLAGFYAPTLLFYFEELKHSFRAARVDSSRVREMLGRIALDRWSSEAPIWGHGILETGPHIVKYMMIGSHHTWYGLLYVKGIIGFIALAFAFIWSLIELIIKSQTNNTARTALGVIIILFFYTFGENLEILSYLYWPGLIILGIAHKEKYVSPFKEQKTGECIA